ncbi:MULTISPECIES: protein-glutamate methylesterase/protein-glutamine glutaminase [Pseudoalteromonas]|uniref:Two-component system, chemotaxis family, response regulator CheB n=2 Tax=Pseudoalteromonas TaxID=53246 RepID=A0ACA8E171_9GAMM|nr:MULTISPECIES: chemotaxis response regulator protein-glutamate methylesterase [Pseudoalteromonas]GEK76697.1 chemotaxis response regulator protein-glutamate methylesterase of group 1 operon [Pseudoalteromonas atlantica]HAG41730.1 chemotaxis response regulator protein-glutamate methylesterase [Pseudoalteromonas sp.]ATC83813.1 two-component system, chemotaxis family, response regulator CheB [Pseudoalteromonas agarivorans DSM 14585]AZN34071.1 chemotaxis response regulator protein-glutamate methyl|tara:strand:+ start:9991 stop:11022 length:1032 start_codon:yes stop_codon:yes gene_type:complete
MVKVLIIDDSPLIRRLLSEILSQASDIEVVGCAEDPYQAREMIKLLNPDVLTLDVEMPKMDGISFLRNLMRLRPMPVVMISTLTQQGSPITLEALELGAVDFIAKPTVNVKQQMSQYAYVVQQKVRVAAGARVRSFKKVSTVSEPLPSNAQFLLNKVIAIGASTGGTEAIKEVLIKMPTNCPAIVITQHIPPVFSTSFAQRMDRTCAINVKEAQHGDKLTAGWAYIAPGGLHLSIKKRGASLYCELDDSEPVNRHKPAVDVLFNSLLECGAKNIVAALLTGMGSDGAKGLLSIKQAGGYTIAQDEFSSVVWGMPKAAVDLGAAHEIVALDKVTQRLLHQAIKV